MPLSARDLLTAAHMVRQRRGDGATAWICGRIAELEMAGDTAGADAWSEILCYLGELESYHFGTLL